MATRAPEAPQYAEVDQATNSVGEEADNTGYSRVFQTRAAVSGVGRALKESYLGVAYTAAERVYGKGESRLRRLGGGAVLLAMTTPAVWGLARGINMLEHMGADAMTTPQSASNPNAPHPQSFELTSQNSRLVDDSKPTGTPVRNTAVRDGEGVYDLLDRDLGKGDQKAEIKELIWGKSQGAKDFRAAMYEHGDAQAVHGEHGMVPSMIGGETHSERQLSTEAFDKLKAFDTKWDADHPIKTHVEGADPAHTLEGGRTIHLGQGDKTIDVNLPKGYEHELTKTKDGFELKINPDGKAQSFTIEIPEKYVDKHGILTAEGRTYLEAQMNEHHLTVDLDDVEAKPNANAKPGDDTLEGKDIKWHDGQNEKTLAIHNNGLITVDLDPKGAKKFDGFPQWNKPFFMAVTDKHHNVYMIPIENSHNHGKAMVDPDSLLGKVLQKGTFHTAVVGQMDSHGKFHGMPAITGNGHADFSDFGKNPAKLTGTHIEATVTEQQPTDPGNNPTSRPDATGGSSTSSSPTDSPNPANTHAVGDRTAQNEKDGGLGTLEFMEAGAVLGIVSGGLWWTRRHRKRNEAARRDWHAGGLRREAIEGRIIDSRAEQWLLASGTGLQEAMNDSATTSEEKALAVRGQMRAIELKIEAAAQKETKFFNKEGRKVAAQQVIDKFNRQAGIDMDRYFEVDGEGKLVLEDGHLKPLSADLADEYVAKVTDFYNATYRKRNPATS